MSARENILARIGKARGSSIAADVDGEIRRHQRGPIPPLAGDLVKRFGERAASLASDVAQARTITEVPDLVARYLRERQLPMQGVCWPALAPYGWQAAGIELQTRAARGDDLVGVTGAFAGIAETGTLMLLSGPETPATVSLLPETHVAVLESATHRGDHGAGLGPAARRARRAAARGEFRFRPFAHGGYRTDRDARRARAVSGT